MSNNDDSDMDGLIGFISGAILGICLTCLFVSVVQAKKKGDRRSTKSIPSTSETLPDCLATIPVGKRSQKSLQGFTIEYYWN